MYAMGATLYRCVTGELPPDSIQRVHNDTLKAPSELGAALPPQVEQAILKALAVHPEDRFPTMEAFLEGLSGKPALSFHHRTMTAPAASPSPRPGRKAGLRQSPLGVKAAAVLICGLVVGLSVWGAMSVARGERGPVPARSPPRRGRCRFPDPVFPRACQAPLQIPPQQGQARRRASPWRTIRTIT